MTGLGAVLRALYLLFAVAAGGRSLVQWLDDPGRAPLAYALSTFAFGLYLVGYLLLRRHDPRSQRLLAGLAAAELCGVLAVGTLSLARPDLFPQPTLWSGYGVGYAFVPLAIPVMVLVWLHRSRDARADDRALAPSLTPPQPARQGSTH